MEYSHANEIKSFFNYETDKLLQKRMLQGNCVSWTSDAIAYIHAIINVPIESFIEYIESLKRQPIVAADVFQFSDFDNATKNLCSKINCTENAGLNFLEIGKLLQNDGVVRKDGAYTKYGENHIKMAEAIGLAFKNERIYYLSPLGCVFNNLSEEDKNKLLIRLILRNKLISQLILVASKGELGLEAFLYDLSESTYLRRKSNIKYVFEILNSSVEYDFVNITKNIKY